MVLIVIAGLIQCKSPQQKELKPQLDSYFEQQVYNQSGALNEESLNFPSGTEFSYSNSGLVQSISFLEKDDSYSSFIINNPRAKNILFEKIILMP